MICSAFMVFSITVRANQVIAGTALTILGIGFPHYIPDHFRNSETSPQVESLTKFDIPFLSSILILNDIFQHNLIVYLAYTWQSFP